ncbi:MAG: hypothetical protein IJ688_08780 [Treponema sp.]|nr:hypothetical protein [Treponema sp.]
MKIKRVLLGLIFIFSISSIHAQSAEVITDILNADKVSFGQVCYLVAVEKGFIKESSSYEEAIEALYKRNMIPSLVYEDTPVPMVNLAYLYSQIFDVKGGVLFKLFHGAPRYAYKQFKYDGVLPVTAFPEKLVSGQEALDIYTSCMIEYTDFQLTTE